jgi:hypothetical protein
MSGHRTIVDSASALAWRRDGDGWVLLAGHRRFGRVVPDEKHRGMFRSPKSFGRLSDMANLSWSKSVVLVAAELEIEWEQHQRRVTDPQKIPAIGGCFWRVIVACASKPSGWGVSKAGAKGCAMTATAMTKAELTKVDLPLAPVP